MAVVISERDAARGDLVQAIHGAELDDAAAIGMLVDGCRDAHGRLERHHRIFPVVERGHAVHADAEADKLVPGFRKLERRTGGGDVVDARAEAGSRGALERAVERSELSRIRLGARAREVAHDARKFDEPTAFGRGDHVEHLRPIAFSGTVAAKAAVDLHVHAHGLRTTSAAFISGGVHDERELRERGDREFEFGREHREPAHT